MTLLALIRHGETDWNEQGKIQGSTDVPLNATGIDQAIDVASLLSSHPFAGPWSGVVTSPLSRAAVTGETIARSLGVPVHSPISGLVERNYGECEGVGLDSARSLYPDGKYPGAESNEAVLERTLSSLDRIRLERPVAPLIVVTHGGLLHTLLSHLNGERVESIENATINLIEFAQNGRWVIRAINGKVLT